MATADMPRSYNAACSHVFVADLDPPELATNEDWCGIMQRARKAHKIDGKEMTQAQLAERVGRRIRERWPQSSVETPSQVSISKIENGQHGSSRFILPICDVLAIPTPDHTADEEERDWIRIGRVMRHDDPDGYRHWKTTLEKLNDRAADQGAPRYEPDRTPPKPK